MYMWYIMPRSTTPPKIDLTNLGRTTLVNPLYATSNGKLAIVGTMSLCLHFKSITSSTKPNNTAMHVASNPALYSTNYIN